MDLQLKRIREKDFTKIDQTLFQNVSRTDNLSFTLTHLSEFQKYLMEQISALNNSSVNTKKDNKISESLVKTFDNLKQSILKCSQIREKASLNKFLQLKKQINQLRKIQQKSIKQIADQNNKVFLKSKSDFEKTTDVIMQKYLSQKQRNQELQQRCQRLQSQMKELRNQRTFLHTQIIQKQNILQIERNNNVRKVEENVTLRQVKPMNKEIVNQINGASKQNANESGWKIMRDRICNSHTSIQKTSTQQTGFSYQNTSTPIRRSNSNHKLSNKAHLVSLDGKQNSSKIMSKCDVIQNFARGKSKQKIKVFSMF